MKELDEAHMAFKEREAKRNKVIDQFIKGELTAVQYRTAIDALI